MSSRTKVSKQVKVTQGKCTTTFELTAKSLVIEQTEGGPAFTRTVLNQAAMDALRELLGMQQHLRTVIREKPLTLPAEEFDERFNKGSSPPRESEGAPTPEGLNRKADGVEEGMGE